MLNSEKILVLGIDPGYDRLGLAIVKKETSKKEELVFSECFTTDKKLPHNERLTLVRNELLKILEEHSPNEASIEALFFSNNKKTAGKVSEVRGVILETLSSFGIETTEYSPTTIKLAVTGNGRATKENIIKMVPLILSGARNIKSDDEMDAVAAAITHLSSRKNLIHNK